MAHTIGAYFLAVKLKNQQLKNQHLNLGVSTHAVESQVNGHWIALASLSPSRDEVYTLATDWRWVQCYAPQLEDRTRPHLKPTNKSWRVDETYVRIRGHWFY